MVAAGRGGGGCFRFGGGAFMGCLRVFRAFLRHSERRRSRSRGTVPLAR